MTTIHHARLLQRYKNTERPDRPEFWDLYDSHFPYSEEMPTSSNNPMLRLLYGNVTPEEFYEPIWFGELKEVLIIIARILSILILGLTLFLKNISINLLSIF